MRLQPLVRDRERLPRLLDLREPSLRRRELRRRLPDRGLRQAVPASGRRNRTQVPSGRGVDHGVRMATKVGCVVVRGRVRDRERREVRGREALQELAQLGDAAAREDTERSSLVVVKVARRRPTELLKGPFAEGGDAREREVRDPLEVLQHGADSRDGQVVAVGEVDPFERASLRERLDCLVGDVVDANEADALQSRQVRREVDDGLIGQICAVCG